MLLHNDISTMGKTFLHIICYTFCIFFSIYQGLSPGGAQGFGYTMEDLPPFNHYPRGELPTPEVAAQILQNHSTLMQQLEIENSYVRVS